MIRKWIIEECYDRGIIQLVMSPHNDGVVCQIGEHWFYFGGYTAEKCRSVEEYKAITSEEVIISDIFVTLNDFLPNEETKDEYRYYHCYLLEKLGEALGSIRFREMCYNLYKQDWKRSHLISREVEIDMIKNYYQDYLPHAGRKPMSYQQYIEEVGYHGELYVCIDEFMESEYQDEKYMHTLLDNEELIAMYDKDIARFNGFDDIEDSSINLRTTAECIATALEDCGFNDVTDSSGYFVIRKFEEDGPDRAVDVYKSTEGGTPHYVIACSYEDESMDYRYTEDLSIDGLEKELQAFHDEESAEN